MTGNGCRPDAGVHRGDVDHSEVSTERSRITRLPVRSPVAALDHLDVAGFCCCWVAPRGRRCKARWSR
jgi:hypothetical protein